MMLEELHPGGTLLAMANTVHAWIAHAEYIVLLSRYLQISALVDL